MSGLVNVSGLVYRSDWGAVQGIGYNLLDYLRFLPLLWTFPLYSRRRRSLHVTPPPSLRRVRPVTVGAGRRRRRHPPGQRRLRVGLDRLAESDESRACTARGWMMGVHGVSVTARGWCHGHCGGKAGGARGASPRQRRAAQRSESRLRQFHDSDSMMLSPPAPHRPRPGPATAARRLVTMLKIHGFWRGNR